MRLLSRFVKYILAITVAYRKNGNVSKCPTFAIGSKGGSDYVAVNINLPPVLPPLRFGSRPGENADYQETESLISGTDFKTRLKT